MPVAQQSRADPGIARWAQYDSAVLGLKEYWYPVARSRDVRQRRALTICGKKLLLGRRGGRVRALPIAGDIDSEPIPMQARWGILWLWLGAGAPVPLEDDVPAEFLNPGSRIYWRFSLREGNWRYA